MTDSYSLVELLGTSPVFEDMKDRARQMLARAGSGGRLPPVLIQGETGTGKGLLARALHRATPRAAAPFVAVNCGAVPETLGESEFFGFARGAHSEARHPKIGFFQAADRGVMFLDEVGLLSEGHQARLLKVVEDRQVIPVGSTKPIPVDVWLISATNADLWADVQEHRFRRDLYERLAVITFTLPPLRERPGDIVGLARQFLARACADYGLQSKTLAPDAQKRLLDHAWPGNVRELSNVIERAALLVEADTISADRLELTSPGLVSLTPPVTRPSASRADRRERIAEALEGQGGNITRAAADLGVSRKTLRDWMKQEGLYPPTGSLDRPPSVRGSERDAPGTAAPPGDHGESPSREKGLPPFVGRTHELALLDRWFQDAAGGHPRVVLIQGDAGIGKTRLLQEAMSIARRLRMEICFGRSYEDLALPYLPFVEGLLPQLEQMPDDIRQSIGADIQIIGQLLHRPGPLPPETRPSISGQADHEKLQLFRAVGRATVKFAQSRPMLFVVEDLHWADRLSLDLFDHVAFTVVDTATKEPVPLVIIGTHRQLPSEERLSRLSARLQREDICRTITLGGLNELEIHELIGGLGVARPSHQLTVTVSDATHGNPLFVQEVLHHLALQEQGGYVVTTTAASELRLPDQVTAAIVTRAEGLTESCRRLVTLASFLGDSFSLQTLAVVSGVSEDEVLNLLEEGMRQHLLRSEGQTFQFAHPLIRHAFYHEPSGPRRQRFHKQIADSFQSLYADSVDKHVLEIAHHLVKAGPAAPQAAVVKFARHAADQAFGVFAWSEAAFYYEAALAAATSSLPLQDRDRADLHYRAGLAHYYDQDIGPCLHQYKEAIEIYRLAGDVQGLAQALMERTRTQFTLATVPFGTVADIKPLEDVLAALGDREPGLRGHILAVIAEAYRNGRQAEKARDRAQRALKIGRALEDDLLSAYASFALALAYMNDLHVIEALEGWENALVYARRAHDVIREGWALRSIPLALTLLGRLNETEAVATRACESARKSQDWSSYSLGLSHLASVAVAKGDFDAAERWAHETMLMVSRSRYPFGGFRSLLALACARALRGAWAEAEDALDVLVEPGRVFEDAGSIVRTFARVFRQLLRADAGSVGEALEPLAVELMKTVGTDTYSVAPLCALVELAALADLPAVAKLPHEALSSAADRGVLFSSGWMFVIPRILGGVATLERRWDASDAHFRMALDVATGVGARPELGRTYLDYARMLMLQDAASNRVRAVELLKEAFKIFVELGMHPYVRRSEQLAEVLGIRLPATPPRPGVYPDDLSEREVDVLVRMAQGHNRQKVAADLVLGQRTVAGHMTSILDKIRVGDEEAAKAYTLEQGLTSRVDRGGMPQSVEEAEGATRTLRIILVTDVVGSTELIQRAGDARAHHLLRTHNMLIRQCLATHQGTEVVHTGDGIEASFLSASAAVESAVAIQKAFARHNREHRTDSIQVRIGINAGEPIPTEGRLFGAAVHAAFRICERALAGQILVSEVVHQLIAGKGFRLVGRGRVDLKGLGRVRVYAVGWEDDGAC